LLFFGYLTVNFNKKNKSYLLQQSDMIFGWFLFKNFTFFYKLRENFYQTRKPYNFLEYEASLNTFVCLRLPIKYRRNLISDDRLIANKFVKYTYLKTY